jgi:hypothetical protein
MIDNSIPNYGTWTSAARRGTATATFSGLQWAALIPEGATVNSVTAIFRHYESSTADVASVTIDGVAVPLVTSATEHRVPLGVTVPPDPIDVVFTRGNNTRSTTCYVDYLEIEVDYSDFLGSPLQAWDGSAWKPGRLKKWNGSSWEGAMLRRWDGSQWVEVV